MTNNYYKKHKEKLWKEACKKYENLSREEKNKRWKNYQNLSVKDIKILLKKKNKENCQYHRECNKNLSKEQKKKLVEYKRNCYITIINNYQAALHIFKRSCDK